MSMNRMLLAVLLSACSLPVVADDWPQWLGPQRDGVWREKGIIKTFPKDGPAVRWRTKIGAGYSGPAVVGDRVFVTDRVKLQGADPDSAFARGAVPSSERVLCLDEATGKIVWEHSYPCVYTVSYPAGPRCTPTVHDGQVITLGSEGHLFCLAAADGKVIWSHDFKQDYSIRQSPTWGFSSHPLVDGKQVICLVGGEGTAVVSFDRVTGKELWRALSAVGAHGPGYSPPLIVEAAGVRQLIVWLPTAVNSLNPETGKVLWSHSFPLKNGLSVPTPRVAGDLLFLTAFYDGSLMLKLNADKPGASEVWRKSGKDERNTDALHSIMPTPFIENGHIYGVCSYGELRCLKADTGERVWQDLTATGADKLRNARWANAFLIKHDDGFFLANEGGDLIRANLTPKGYQELSRTKLLNPTNHNAGRPVVWSHPAFAHRCVFARNDEEIVCVSLAAE
jgi:outer membrane protein assembly factor BamB